MRRAVGAGSLFYSPRIERWMSVSVIPTERGQVRRSRRITGRTFCEVLRRFSAEHPFDPSLGPASRDALRKSRMEAAKALGAHTQAEWLAIVKRANHCCEYCGGYVTMLNHTWTRDHKIPVSRGGSDAADNLVLCCRACNNSKGTMTADEFLAWRAA